MGNTPAATKQGHPCAASNHGRAPWLRPAFVGYMQGLGKPPSYWLGHFLILPIFKTFCGWVLSLFLDVFKFVSLLVAELLEPYSLLRFTLWRGSRFATALGAWGHVFSPLTVMPRTCLGRCPLIVALVVGFALAVLFFCTIFFYMLLRYGFEIEIGVFIVVFAHPVCLG